jgi:hypothetical protein
VFGERDVTDLLPRYAAAAGLTPEQFTNSQTLSPVQQERALTMMRRTKEYFDQQSSTGHPDDSQETVGRTAAPVMASGAGGGAPGGVAPGGGGPSTPVGNESQAQFYEDRARRSMAASALYGASPQAAAAAQKAAEDDFARAKDIRETSAKYGETLDPRMQQAARDREIDKLRSVEADKRKAQVFKTGSEAEDAVGQTALSRRIVNSPGFNSGVGAPFFDALQSLNQQMFGGTALKNPGEIYDKLRAPQVLSEIRSLGGSGIGAVRVPEMKQVDKLIADRSIQAPAIRTIVEVEDRLAGRLRDIYHMAQDYLQTHRELDDGFVRQVSAFKSKNELFSKAELANPSLLAMPVFSSPAEMRASRMPGGTKFRNSNGEVGSIP